MGFVVNKVILTWERDRKTVHAFLAISKCTVTSFGILRFLLEKETPVNQPNRDKHLHPSHPYLVSFIFQRPQLLSQGSWGYQLCARGHFSACSSKSSMSKHCCFSCHHSEGPRGEVVSATAALQLLAGGGTHCCFLLFVDSQIYKFELWN